MPIRGYLSEYQLFDDGQPEGAQWFAPTISVVLNSREIGYQSLDLRTAEQQGQIPAQGWALVLANVRPPDHTVVMQTPNTFEVTAGTTVAEIRAIIGDEATDDVFEGSTIDQLKAYFQNCHKGRVDRWQGRI